MSQASSGAKQAREPSKLGSQAESARHERAGRRPNNKGGAIKNRTIFTGDNLHIMRGMEDESVDLIYLDPPFNSKHDYNTDQMYIPGPSLRPK